MSEDRIGPTEMAAISFGLTQSLLQLLLKVGTITPAELAHVGKSVRQKLPPGNRYAIMDRALEAMTGLNDAARSDDTATTSP